jgi:hypothetical protein
MFPRLSLLLACVGRDSDTCQFPFQEITTFAKKRQKPGIKLYWRQRLIAPPPPQWLCSHCKDLGRLTHDTCYDSFGRVISPSEGLYLHRITQHIYIRGQTSHTLNEIRTHDLSVQAIRPTPQTKRPLWPAS